MLPLILIWLVSYIPFLIMLGLNLTVISLPMDMNNFPQGIWIIFIVNILLVIMGSIALFLSSIAINKVVADVCQGYPLVWKEVLLSIKNKWKSYLGASILIGLAIAFMFFAIHGSIFLMMLAWDYSGAFPYRNYLLMGIFGPCILFIALFLMRFMADYSMTFAAMFVDNTRCDESFKRSKLAAKGNRWRILGYLACMMMLGIIYVIITFLIISKVPPEISKGPYIIIFVYHEIINLAISMVQVMMTSGCAIVCTLLYLNLKKQPDIVTPEIIA